MSNELMIQGSKKISGPFLGMISHSGDGVDLDTKDKAHMEGAYKSNFHGTFAVDTDGRVWFVHRTYGAKPEHWTWY